MSTFGFTFGHGKRFVTSASSIEAQKALVSDAEHENPPTTNSRQPSRPPRMRGQARASSSEPDDYQHNLNPEVVDLTVVTNKLSSQTMLPSSWYGWVCFAIIMLVFLIIFASEWTSFVFAIIANAKNYLKGSHVTKNGHYINWHQESRSDLLVWGSTVDFNQLRALNPRGKKLVANYSEINTVWLRNHSSASQYYNLDQRLSSLSIDLAGVYLVVQPTELENLVNPPPTAKRQAQTYSNPFVEFLDTMQLNITSLETQNTNIAASTPCRGKPFEVTTGSLLGTQTLALNDTASLAWVPVIQQPSLPLPNFANASPTNITALLQGVYTVSMTAVFVVPAYQTAVVTVVVAVDARPFNTCHAAQPNTTLPTSNIIQCTASGLLNLATNSSISVQAAFASGSAPSIATAFSTRLQIQRVC